MTAGPAPAARRVLDPSASSARDGWCEEVYVDGRIKEYVLDLDPGHAPAGGCRPRRSGAAD